MAFQLRAMHLRLAVAVIIGLATGIYLYQSFNIGNSISDIGFSNTTNDTSLDIYDPKKGTGHASLDTYDPNNGTTKDMSIEEMLAAGVVNGWLTAKTIIDGKTVEENTFYGADAVEQHRKHVEKRELEKRARNPWTVPLMPSNVMCGYVNKGRNQLTVYMLQDEAAAGATMTQAFGADPRGLNWQRSDLSKSGFLKVGTDWSYVDYTNAGNNGPTLQPIVRALTSLRIGDQQQLIAATPWRFQRQINMQLLPNGPNVAVRWTQDKEYYPGTNGQFASIYNPIDGVIIIQGAWSPTYMLMRDLQINIQPPADALPILKQWSDVTWMQWKRLRDSQYYQSPTFRGFIPGSQYAPSSAQLKSMLPWLNWIVVSSIQSPPETLTIISVCIASRGFKNGAVSTWDNRQTFIIGHWCYYALLACKNNYGLAWLLIQHKGASSLGHKAFRSVTIFWGDDGANPQLASWPTLIWQVADMAYNPGALLTVKNGVEARWMNFQVVMNYEDLPVDTGAIGNHPN
ncbi:hypothetical protein LTR85_002082 [Meristemomyces frigidus]|nr:hypothetical protein LTR85_002082 [Meristemomyces frigidus]